jgi:CheY-like chemotaxis protein
MTAHAMKGDQERCLVVGMDAYISKPIKREELLEMVERLAEDDNGRTESPFHAAADEVQEDTR